MKKKSGSSVLSAIIIFAVFTFFTRSPFVMFFSILFAVISIIAYIIKKKNEPQKKAAQMQLVHALSRQMQNNNNYHPGVNPQINPYQVNNPNSFSDFGSTLSSFASEDYYQTTGFQDAFRKAQSKGLDLDPWNLPRELDPWE